MKCEHCNEEIDKYYNKKYKVCKPCYQRMTNCKSRGLKYIKFIDLSEKEKQVIINKRNSHKKTIEKELKKFKSSNEPKIVIHKVGLSEKDIVLDDIKQSLAENNLKWPEDTTSIVPIFKQLKILLDGYINNYLNVEDIINKMEMDYRHAKEYYSTEYERAIKLQKPSTEVNKLYSQKLVWEERHNALLSLRRGIKNVITEYNNGGVLFTELSKNKEFMDNFNKHYSNLILSNNMSKEVTYKPKASKLVASEEFCSDLEEHDKEIGITKFRYEVIVKTFNRLTKVKDKTNFIRNVWAQNEEEAKQSVVNFITENNFRFGYSENEIIVNKLSGNIHNENRVWNLNVK